MEAEAQLYSYNIDLKIMQVKIMQSYKTDQVGGRASQVGGITCMFKGKNYRTVRDGGNPTKMAVETNSIMQVMNIEITCY